MSTFGSSDSPLFYSMSSMIIMRNFLFPVYAMFLVMLMSSFSDPDYAVLAPGEQPQLSMDSKGVVRTVFGRNDSIFCSTSNDAGATFSKSVLVGKVSQMHLGMTRGPQIASSDNFTIITVMDKPGNIHYFQLDHAKDTWSNKGFVNDTPSAAPEGLMSIAADKQNNFYAVWLDLRNDGKNKIGFSSLSAKEGKWTKNSIAYKSPDETVCECCKPNIAVEGSQVVIMFRNWLEGSRDLHFIESADQGKTFGKAQKLGLGTWKLSGCPMDGGGLTLNKNAEIHTVWQREGKIFYAQPHKSEVRIGAGRACYITGNDFPVMTWQDGKKLNVQELGTANPTTIGEGSALVAIRTKDNKILYVWEHENSIVFKKI